MSKFGLILGFFCSVALHYAMLSGSPGAAGNGEDESGQMIAVSQTPDRVPGPAPMVRDADAETDSDVNTETPPAAEADVDAGMEASGQPEPAGADPAAAPQPTPAQPADGQAEPASPTPGPASPPASPQAEAPAAPSNADDTATTGGVGLSINWGANHKQAMGVIRAGQMKLVVLDEFDNVYRQVVFQNDTFQLQPIHWALGMTYSNRVRIVHEHPAFAEARRSLNLRPGEVLAVYLPLALDRQLESAQMRASMQTGIPLEDIRSFGGEFRVTSTGVRFVITEIAKR